VFVVHVQQLCCVFLQIPQHVGFDVANIILRKT
jgi:hypothetical protein